MKLAVSSLRRCILISLALTGAVVAACDGGETERNEPKSPGERLCQAIADAIQGCGMATPCDQALVADCAELVSSFSDPYLEAAADCIEAGGIPQQCLVDALGALQPTAAQAAFAAQFCSECALGIPGCEEQVFGSGEYAIAGKIILPLGDELVGDLAAECATGLTCAATFVSCAQGVLAKRAIPENTLQCLFDTLTGQIPPGMESNCTTGSGPSTGPGGGMPCVDAEECPADQVCDPTARACVAPQCATAADCTDGECVQQIEGVPSGACYTSCVPFGGSSCATEQSCLDTTGEGLTGICKYGGQGALGQPCTRHDVTTGCVANQLCGDLGEGPVCIEQCDYWGNAAVCSDGAQACMLQSLCVEPGYVDPVAVGQVCTASAVGGDFCAQNGARILGSCQDLGMGLECFAFCRVSQNDCAGGLSCTPFQPPIELFGLCL
jgi:hypothetical protein